jgi:molecular chaperone DnaK
MGKIIGIDLGTTNSVVAIMEGKEPRVIVNEEGHRTTPSVVAWDKNDNILVGQVARRQAITNPEKTIYSVKRFMGRSYDESVSDMSRLPYKLERGANGRAEVSISGRKFSPPDVSAHVLMKLKAAAEKYLGEAVTDAVITVPAYFNDAQRQATKDAGAIAGLNVKRIVNEPTAAALAYGLDKKKDGIVAVYDLGGGTFDISILEIGGGITEVLSTNGDTHLGGDDFDDVLMDHLIDVFKKENGIDVSKDNMVRQRLKEAAEKAKIELSNATQTDINLPFLTADATGPKHLNLTLTRSDFEKLIYPLVKRSIDPCIKALKDSGKTKDQIDEVLLVGGSTRVPLVQREVEKLFGKAPNQSVNPDEVVALGAAVQGGVLTGDVTDILLLDVTPLSLGIETLGGVMTTLIQRNTTIPTSKEETFSTAADNQTAVTVHVLQGERQFARDNKTLGKFNLEGIPPAPRGVPQIKVKFDVDANGIVNVTAVDVATGKQQKITVTGSSSLDKAEIDKKIREAEEFREADAKRKKAIETRNQADSLAHQVEKSMEEMGDKISDAHKSELETAIQALKDTLSNNTDGDDVTDIETATKNLESVSNRVFSEVYQNASAQSQAAPQGAEDDDVIDADYTEKK